MTATTIQRTGSTDLLRDARIIIRTMEDYCRALDANPIAPEIIGDIREANRRIKEAADKLDAMIIPCTDDETRRIKMLQLERLDLQDRRKAVVELDMWKTEAKPPISVSFGKAITEIDDRVDAIETELESLGHAADR